jgi:hypothetical protein
MNKKINLVRKLVKNVSEIDLHIKDAFGINRTIYPGKEKAIYLFTEIKGVKHDIRKSYRIC